MKALRYGALPLCRCVGAPRDLVVDADLPSGSGNGFCLASADADALAACVRRVVAAHVQRRFWSALVRTAMRQVHSWELCARRNLAVYPSAL